MNQEKLLQQQIAITTPLFEVVSTSSFTQAVSAREVYLFLELNPNNWSRWAEENILNNRHNVEGVDWIIFDTMSNDSGISLLKRNKNTRGRKAKDYIVTTDFAERIAMTVNTDKGEEARRWFQVRNRKLIEIERGQKEKPFKEAIDYMVTRSESITDKTYLDEEVMASLKASGKRRYTYVNGITYDTFQKGVAHENDVINIAVFGMSSAQWKKANPNLSVEKNIRSMATKTQLKVLNEIQIMDRMLVHTTKSIDERITLLTKAAEKAYMRLNEVHPKERVLAQ